MKGFTHFISGLAAATFFPEAVEMALRDNSFILILGGIGGILPDTFDFKFAQFFEHYHYKIDPDPDNPDPQKIAQTIADTINEAHQIGKTRSVKLYTIQKANDVWRQYRIHFNTEKNKVEVHMGELVSTSKRVFPGTKIEGANNFGEALIQCPMEDTLYEKDIEVDIFGGPSFAFVPQKNGKIRMDFIAWHRRWSHSLVLAVFIGLFLWGLLWLSGFANPFLYATIAACGFAVHVLEDQLGHLGSNLLWPFTKDRVEGMKTMHSSHGWGNFGTVWLALSFIIYNLNRFRPEPVFPMDPIPYFLIIFAMPLLTIYVVDLIIRATENEKNA